MFKKVLALLLVTFLFTIKFGLFEAFASNINNNNLKDFLSDKKEVFIKYEYPSLKLASNVKSASIVTIPAGTPIVLRNLETIDSSNITNGSSIVFKTINDIVVDNKVVIKAGSNVDAQVSYAKKKNYAGIAGEITISDFMVKAVDGTYIPLKATLSSKGEEKIAISVGLGLLICVLFLLMKGEDAVIPAGTTKSVYTMMDVKINTANL